MIHLRKLSFISVFTMVSYSFISSESGGKPKQMQMGIIPQAKKNKDCKTIAKEKLHYDADQCPCCKKGKMITLLSFDAHGPPPEIMKKWQQQQAKNKQ